MAWLAANWMPVAGLLLLFAIAAKLIEMSGYARKAARLLREIKDVIAFAEEERLRREQPADSSSYYDVTE